MIVSMPAVAGIYPVTAVGSPLKDAVRTSVVATFVALTVTTVAQAAEEIEEVPSAAVPLAIVVVRPPAAERLFASAPITPVPTAGQAIVVEVEFSIRHGAVAPTTVVVPGVMDAAAPPLVLQLITAPLEV